VQSRASAHTFAPRQERIVAYARKEPGLLSWNVSTLLNRIMAVRSMLKLPPELALTLLAFNRPLLSNPQMMPQKLQALQRVLGVTGAALSELTVRQGSGAGFLLVDAAVEHAYGISQLRGRPSTHTGLNMSSFQPLQSATLNLLLLPSISIRCLCRRNIAEEQLCPLVHGYTMLLRFPLFVTSISMHILNMSLQRSSCILLCMAT
jgi:hypothetical protein